jgi:hypothetical protein
MVMLASEVNGLKYEDRVVAFIDVLGFADLVKDSENNLIAMANVGKLVTVAKAFETFVEKYLNHNGPDSFVSLAIFSDCFVFSMNPDQIIYMVRWTGHLYKYLLQNGFLCRGAIATGALYHRERIVVGPALVKAYELEQAVAVYPRVILDAPTLESWAEEFRPGSAHPHVERLVKQDRDGQRFLDIFNPVWADFQPSFDTVPNDGDEFLKAVYQPIQNGLTDNRGRAKILAKYSWLASEYNDRARDRGFPLLTSL